MKSEGWRNVRKGFKTLLQGTEGFCVFVAKVQHRGLATSLRMFAALSCMYGAVCVYILYVHAAKAGIA